ncbi:hypothetical protein F4776DRAFT_518663 [Hypoxylon sp. NC0597]|nr:hypothetical protein F4776DRAFT_518663 [Hypoxylon sp. NC0597]
MTLLETDRRGAQVSTISGAVPQSDVVFSAPKVHFQDIFLQIYPYPCKIPPSLCPLNGPLQYKHLMIVFYVELFMTSVSVWLSLLARCVRRVNERCRTHEKLAGGDYDIGEEPLLNRPTGSSLKGLPSLMMSLVTPLIGFLITGIIYHGTSGHWFSRKML